MNKLAIFIIISSLLFSCKKTDKPEVIPTTNKAVAVYNQAYQENFEEDKIVDILVNAHYAYVLIDPFVDSNFTSIPAIKANGNEVGAYISIGTGETYRDDFMQALHLEYPMYDWHNNKGYPTLKHREAIRKHGATAFHRQSFRLLPDEVV